MGRVVQDGYIIGYRHGGYMKLTHQQEKDLIKDYQRTGDINKVYNYALRFVNIFLRDYYGHDKEDLYQECCIGLLRGIRKFDVEQDLRLETYVKYWIRAMYFEHMRKRNIVKISKRDFFLKDSKGQYIAKTSCTSFDNPGPEGLSLDSLLHNENSPDPVDVCTEKEVFDILDSIEDLAIKDMVINSYGLYGRDTVTLVELGKKHNMSKEWVRLNIKKCIKHLQLKVKV